MPKITHVDIPATEIPPTIARKIPGGPIPGMRYRVTIEEIEDNAAKLAALRATIAERLAQADAGEGIDADEVFAELHKRFPNPDA